MTSRKNPTGFSRGSVNILDKLVEKKDIACYIDTRIAHLKTITKKKSWLMGVPEKKRQSSLKVIEGRIRELLFMKKTVAGNEIKKLSKQYWRERAKMEGVGIQKKRRTKK